VTTAFGPFTLDDEARQLCRGAEPIHLSPKAFDLLALLIHRRPEAISKSEILDTLWRNTFVSEGNLAVLVKELRDALDDDAQRPTYIRTVQRFGYGFAAPAAEPVSVVPISPITPAAVTKSPMRVTITARTSESAISKSRERRIAESSAAAEARAAYLDKRPPDWKWR